MPLELMCHVFKSPFHTVPNIYKSLHLQIWCRWDQKQHKQDLRKANQNWEWDLVWMFWIHRGGTFRRCNRWRVVVDWITHVIFCTQIWMSWEDRECWNIPRWLEAVDEYWVIIIASARFVTAFLPARLITLVYSLRWVLNVSLVQKSTKKRVEKDRTRHRQHPRLHLHCIHQKTYAYARCFSLTTPETLHCRQAMGDHLWTRSYIGNRHENSQKLWETKEREMPC